MWAEGELVSYTFTYFHRFSYTEGAKGQAALREKSFSVKHSFPKLSTFFGTVFWSSVKEGWNNE